MLTGQTPFMGKTPMTIIAHQIHDRLPLEESETSKLPKEVIQLMEWMTQKEPFKRPASYEELLQKIHMISDQLSLSDVKFDDPPDILQENAQRRREKVREISQTSAILKKHPLSYALRYVLPLLFVIGGLILYGHWGNQKIKSLAVLPFVNASGDPDIEYLSDGITDSTINSLSQLRDLRVMARTTVFTYKGKQIDPRKIRKDLEVDTLVTGKMLQHRGMLMVQVELVNAINGTQIWGQQYSRPIQEIFAMQSELSKDISEKIRSKISGEEQVSIAKQYTNNLEAYRLFSEGEYFLRKLTPQDTEKAIDFYKRATTADPEYALAYARLANAYRQLVLNGWSRSIDSIPLAKAAATKALALDSTIAHAHVVLGWITAFYEWQWETAEKEFRKGRDLDQNEVWTHSSFAQYLSAMGRHSQAIDEINEASKLDPLTLGRYTDMAWHLYNARRFDEGIEQCNRVIEMDHNFALGYQLRADIYAVKKMPAETLQNAEAALKLWGRDALTLSDLAFAKNALGKRNEARQIVLELKELGEKGSATPVTVASSFLAIGDKNSAIEWLEKAYSDHDVALGFLAVDPWWDPIRSDSRFVDLLKRINLTK
jgi:TolB-like protein/Tfp pilus assembly protein PilF